MSKCSLNANIQNISGRVGSVLYKTYTKADGSKETRMYGLPMKKNGEYGFERKTPPTKKELANRARFMLAHQKLTNLSQEGKEMLAKQWKKDKFMFNGKKYATFRGYAMARIFAELNQQLP
jgi:hypothetical protein